MVGHLNHESNGKVILEVGTELFYMGFERKNWTVYLRPWFRMPAAIDDNQIFQNIGRGDVNIIYVKMVIFYLLMAVII
jgi:phospholipase A1